MFGLSAQTMDVVTLVLMIAMLACPMLLLGRPEAFLRRQARKSKKIASKSEHND